MPLISIIVPVYNVELFLKQSIDSILNQTLRDFELIIIDDGSTDNSPEICDKYAKVDNRIRVIHKNNEKQGAARNYGVKIAKSDLICFIDSDDCVDKTYLETLYRLYKKTNSKIVCCDYFESKHCLFDEIQKDESVTTLQINDDTMSSLYKSRNYYWICWCKLINKKILIDNPFPEGVYYEDNAIVFKWIYNCKEISFTNKRLYFYRINNSGTTKGQNKHLVDYADALEKQIIFFADKEYITTAKLIFDEYIKLTTHLYFTKNKRTPSEAKYLRNKVKHIITNYSHLLSKEDIYSNRLAHPILSLFYRFKRLLKRIFK